MPTLAAFKYCTLNAEKLIRYQCYKVKNFFASHGHREDLAKLVVQYSTANQCEYDGTAINVPVSIPELVWVYSIGYCRYCGGFNWKLPMSHHTLEREVLQIRPNVTFSPSHPRAKITVLYCIYVC